MLDVLDRAGLARTARWSVGDVKITTPNILFHDSAVNPAPSYSEAIVRRNEVDKHIQLQFPNAKSRISIPLDIKFPLSYLAKEKGSDVSVENGVAVVRCPPESMPSAVDGVDAELFVLAGSYELRRDAADFVRSVASLRTAIGYDKLIYAPGIMDPSNLALLSYAGVDLFDSSLLVLQSSRGRVLIPEGSLSIKDASWLVEQSQDDALRYNLQSAWRELNLVRHMIKVGRLREHVETRVQATPWAVAALRILDYEFYGLQEEHTSVTGPRFYANSKQSLDRPDIKRFRERVMNRYQPPRHKKILLLIPCSAKKPYSTSKTHRIYADILESVPNSAVVEELIVTSPLGVVPRELELFYPAAQYDIPVTGHWDRDEVAMVQTMVKKVASQGFDKIIANLGVEAEFVKAVLPESVQTSEGSPTSKSSLRALEEELLGSTKEYERVDWQTNRNEVMRSIARFQFGKGGEAIMDGATVMGKYPFLRIMQKDKAQRGMLTPERGMISLTMEGASTLLENGMYLVEIEDFDLTGNLFAVGVKDADPNIRIGDEAIIVRKGKLEGVGTAMMSGPEMKESKRGEAVRVRHKRKK